MNRILKIAMLFITIVIIIGQQPPLETQARELDTLKLTKSDSVLQANYVLLVQKEVKKELLDSLKLYTEKTDSALTKSKKRLVVLRRQQKKIIEQTKVIDTIIKSQNLKE